MVTESAGRIGPPPVGIRVKGGLIQLDGCWEKKKTFCKEYRQVRGTLLHKNLFTDEKKDLLSLLKIQYCLSKFIH